MTYTTQTELETRFGANELAQLSDRVAGAVIDAIVVDRAIADADAEIEGYLAGRYALPLGNVPPALARIAADIARYRLWSDGATEAVRKRYEDAVRDLRSIGAGIFALDGLASATTTATQDLCKIVDSNNARLFSRSAR